MYRLRLSTLILLCLQLTTSLYGQSLTDRLDSIMATPPDTHQVRSLISLAESFSYSTGVPDTLFQHGLELSHKLKYDWGLAMIYRIRHTYYLNTGAVEKGLLDVEQAIKYARKTGADKLLNIALINEVILLMVGGETEQAAEKAAALVKEFHAANNLAGEAEAYSLLSSLSSSFGNYELALTYDSTAIAVARRSKSSTALGNAILYAAMNRCFLNEPGKALPLAEEALAIAQERSDKLEEGNARNVRAEANTALGNYAEALEDYEFLKVGEGQVKYSWRMINKGALLQRMGRHKEARELLLEAEMLVKATSNDPLELKRCYRALQTVGLNKQQYDTVVWYGTLMEAEQDSLQAAENIKNLLELKEKYQAEEKEIEIRLQQKQLALQQIQLYATIFVLLLALVAGLTFFFLSQRLRKRNVENEQLLKDKETLIGEIHHRVKNNLQVVSSLLQIQRRGLNSDDEKGREALLESQSRVSAMGLIHNKLYQGTEVTSVFMPNYLEELGETLLDAYRLEEQVEIFYDVADISLDVDNAIPLGLIINELVTNSLKYAFPKGREGTIEIALHRENGQLRMAVTDNGVGAAAAEKRADSTSFGGNLIGLLTQKLKGTLRQMEIQGYGVEISFAE